MMAYRPDRQQRRDWTRWLARHRERLLLTGVPEEVYSDPQRWENFLYEAGEDFGSGWHPRMLKEDEAKHLHGFVVELYGESQFRGLLRVLKDRFGIAR